MKDAPKPVVIRYPGGAEEIGVAIDHETVEAGYVHAVHLGLGDVIEIDAVPRTVIGIRHSLATGRPAIPGVDATSRLTHGDPGDRRPKSVEPEGPNPKTKPSGRWVSDS